MICSFMSKSKEKLVKPDGGENKPLVVAGLIDA